MKEIFFAFLTFTFVIITSLFITNFITGCNLVTVEIHQSAILDKGDDTSDKYSNKSAESKIEPTSIRIEEF